MPPPVTPQRAPEIDPAAKFEELFARLEEIVATMEGGELPLDRLLIEYELGTRLLQACQARLVDAEQKIEILSRSAESGAPTPVQAGSGAQEESALDANARLL